MTSVDPKPVVRCKSLYVLNVL